MITKAWSGSDDIHCINVFVSSMSRLGGRGYKPSLIICAIMMIKTAVTNAVNTPKICLT